MGAGAAEVWSPQNVSTESLGEGKPGVPHGAQKAGNKRPKCPWLPRSKESREQNSQMMPDEDATERASGHLQPSRSNPHLHTKWARLFAPVTTMFPADCPTKVFHSMNLLQQKSSHSAHSFFEKNDVYTHARSCMLGWTHSEVARSRAGGVWGILRTVTLAVWPRKPALRR